MNDHDDEPTGEVLPTLVLPIVATSGSAACSANAVLFPAWAAERRLRADMLRAVSAAYEPTERSDDDAEAE